MKIPFTNLEIGLIHPGQHIVNETDIPVMGRDELIDALRKAKRGNAYDRRKALRKAIRAAYKMKVVIEGQERKVWRQSQKPSRIGKPNPMPAH